MDKLKILKYACVALVCVFLLVPYQFVSKYKGTTLTRYHGYELIFSPPKPPDQRWRNEIVWSTVYLEVGAIVAATAFLVLQQKDK